MYKSGVQGGGLDWTYLGGQQHVHDSQAPRLNEVIRGVTMDGEAAGNLSPEQSGQWNARRTPSDAGHSNQMRIENSSLHVTM